MFGTDIERQTRQFLMWSGIEEVGGPPPAGYPSPHVNAEGVEHFL